MAEAHAEGGRGGGIGVSHSVCGSFRLVRIYRSAHFPSRRRDPPAWPSLSMSHPPHVFAQRWCLTRSWSQAPMESISEQLEAAGKPSRSTSEEMISTGESAQISAGSSSNRSPAGSCGRGEGAPS